jgi:predicted DNA-binding transcriptional regulator YafY
MGSTTIMSAAYQQRLDRLKRLERAVPYGTSSSEKCPDGVRLLAIMGDAYGGANDKARRRALQRDLDELVKEGIIEAVNPGSRPLRYRRRYEEPDEDPAVWEYTLLQIRDLVAEALPSRRLDRLWQRLLSEIGDSALDETRVRLVPDTLRLQPVELYPDVLSAVIQALARRNALKVLYEDAKSTRAEACLHPQGLIQRGPIPYLFALKNDEDDPLRLYALHRMIRAEMLDGTPSRAAPGFDLDEAIASGLADFGSGEWIDLELRVRGYVAELLRVCPLSPCQRSEDEPDGSGFDLRVSARLPSTGQLLRWLLGLGGNIEVVGPAQLRRVVAAQALKMSRIYHPNDAALADEGR